MEEPSFRVFGEQAILVEWPFEIDEQGHERLLTYNQLLALFNEAILETVVTYNSIAIYVKPKVDTSLLIQKIKSTISIATVSVKEEVITWEVPCCYEASFAIDKKTISEYCGLSFKECIAIHTKTPYRIYFHGFLPGFLYLGGLDPLLHVPRRATPRAKVNKGAVAIGGKQTGIYPMQSPGGWNILGSTPLDLFNPHNSEAPSPFNPGDYLKFTSITSNQYKTIEKRIAKGNYQLKFTVKDD